MPATINLNTSDFKKLDAQLKKVGSSLGIAVSAALNRTCDFTATAASQIVRDTYSIKSSDVKKTLRKTKSSQRHLQAIITVTGKTLAIYPHFRPGPAYRPQQNKKYKIKVTIKRGHRKQIVISPNAFLPAAGASARNMQIFARQGAARLPVVALHTLSVPQMVTGDAKEQIEQESAQKLQERIQHEIQWRLDKAASAMK